MVPFTIDRFENPRNLVYLVRFIAHHSGCYSISVMRNGQHVKGSPFSKVFDPGKIESVGQ